jgi:lysophospholipase L1-like esterase
MARVALFGDSHTAGDFMSGQLRRRFQAHFGDGGHGFISAGRPWRSFRHDNVDSGGDGPWQAWRQAHGRTRDLPDHLLGLAGVAIESRAGGAVAWVATADTGAVGREASFFEVFYLAHPGGGQFTLRLNDQMIGRLSTRAAVPRPAYHQLRAELGSHELKLETQGRGLVRIFGFVVETDGPGVVVDAMGINGARITALTGWDSIMFSDNLARREPNLVVLWYGANAVGDGWNGMEQYERWVAEAIEVVHQAVPDAACLLIAPPDMARARLEDPVMSGTPPVLMELIARQRSAAHAAGCGYYDLFAAMGGANAHRYWAQSTPPLASGDGIHYTPAGYAVMGDLLFRALMEGYQAFRAERAASRGTSEGAVNWGRVSRRSVMAGRAPL